jgi:competence protein ComEC
MGSIVFTSQIIGKQQTGLITLLLTGFIMLFYNPSFATDVGFQLSFVATWGLLYLPKLFKRFKGEITELLITTVCAQIATLPILISNFGNYSIFSIPTNGLVLWTIPILMILGSFVAIFSFIFPPLAKVFLFLCIPFLEYFEEIVSYFASFGTSFSFSQIPWQFVVGYYLILLSIVVFKYRGTSSSL